MDYFITKLEDLYCECRNTIQTLVEDNGTESKFSDTKVLKVPDEVQFNIGHAGNYVVEINETDLIDQDGNQYDHSVIDINQLFSIVDHIMDF